MEVEFVEGKCCGDCAKCWLPRRPRSAQGIQACAIANILPKVFCTHDLIVEQNALISKLTKTVKKQGEEIAKLSEKIGEKEPPSVEFPEEEKPEAPEEESAEEHPAEEGEEKPEAKKLPKTKK